MKVLHFMSLNFKKYLLIPKLLKKMLFSSLFFHLNYLQIVFEKFMDEKTKFITTLRKKNNSLIYIIFMFWLLWLWLLLFSYKATQMQTKHWPYLTSSIPFFPQSSSSLSFFMSFKLLFAGYIIIEVSFVLKFILQKITSIKCEKIIIDD